jgi:hypothetical protein
MDREDIAVDREAFDIECRRVMTLHEERSSEIDREYDDMLEDRRRFAEELADFDAEKEELLRRGQLQQVATECLLTGERQLAALVKLACVVTSLIVGVFAITVDRMYFDGAALTSAAALGWRVAERLADGESLEHDI